MKFFPSFLGNFKSDAKSDGTFQSGVSICATKLCLFVLSMRIPSLHGAQSAWFISRNQALPYGTVFLDFEKDDSMQSVYEQFAA